jgi:hypothetical protein
MFSRCPVRNYQINEFRIDEAMHNKLGIVSRPATTAHSLEKTASGFAARGLR